MFKDVISFKYDQIAYLALKVKENKPNLEPAGDWVLSWGRVIANFLDDRPSAIIKFHIVFRIKDGKINLTNSYYDEADYMQPQGHTFIPPKTDSTSME